MLEFRLMKVLLVSPRDPDRPGKLRFLLGGENTFTRSLLSRPPSGVKYVHYQRALQEKRIVYTGWREPFSCLMKTRIWPPDAGVLCFKLKDRFDLIHCHGYSLKLDSLDSPPVVLSDSSSNYLFLRDYLGWGDSRIRLGYVIRKFLVKKLDIYDPNLNLREAPLVVWSEFAKKIHLDLGADPKKITVIPPGIEKAKYRKKEHREVNILFVGTWLERKGGLLLLRAYEVLKRKYPEIGLILVGQLPKKVSLPKDTRHWDFVPRQKLAEKIFPQADILVLVPPLAEGYGVAVLEAASYGIPAVVSSVYALPEIIKDRETGFVIDAGSLDQLLRRLEILIKNRNLREKMGQAAEKNFTKQFWIKNTNRKLLNLYQSVLKQR